MAGEWTGAAAGRLGSNVIARGRNAGLDRVDKLTTEAVLNLLKGPQAKRHGSVPRVTVRRYRREDGGGDERKYHIRFAGLGITIENRKGSMRSGARGQYHVLLVGTCHTCPACLLSPEDLPRRTAHPLGVT